jgi:putative transposase
MNKQFFSRKKIRLDSSFYLEPALICSITICTQRNKSVFHRIEFGQACIEILIENSERKEIPVYAFCFMPDHVHLLLSASLLCSIPSFVGGFKSSCARAGWVHFGLEKSFWQKRYYDHFLRKEENIKEVTYYILNNPLRRGLGNDWRDYPLSGSLVFEL